MKGEEESYHLVVIISSLEGIIVYFNDFWKKVNLWKRELFETKEATPKSFEVDCWIISRISLKAGCGRVEFRKLPAFKTRLRILVI